MSANGLPELPVAIPHLASVLRQCRRSANIHASSGVIRGIPDTGTPSLAASDRKPPEARHYKSKLDLIDFVRSADTECIAGYPMPTEMTEHKSESRSIDAPAADKAGAALDRDAKTPHTDPASKPVPPGGQRSTRRRRLLLGMLGVLVLAAALWFGIPYILLTLRVCPKTSGGITKFSEHEAD